MYSQIVERVEVSLTNASQNEKTKGLTGKASLGNLLSFLGIDIGMETNLATKNATSTQVVLALTPIQKCTLVYEILAKTKQLSYLNDDLILNTNPHLFVRFNCAIKCDFQEMDVYYKKFQENTLDTKAWLPNYPMEFIGTIQGYKIKLVCFGQYFIVSPNFAFMTLLRSREFMTSGLASVFDVNHENKEVVLSPIALWGPYE